MKEIVLKNFKNKYKNNFFIEISNFLIMNSYLILTNKMALKK